MLPYSFYLLKVIICSGILSAYYFFLLRNKLFHNYNRFYLLLSVIISLTLPLIKISVVQETTEVKAIKLLQAVNVSDEYLEEIHLTAKQTDFPVEQILFTIYCCICFVLFTLLMVSLFKIFRLIRTNTKIRQKDIFIIKTEAKGSPFSFLNYIFWNENIDLLSPTGEKIFKHELTHIKQKHSYDKLFINSILVICWCNPFFWLIRKELYMVHEFIADENAVEDYDIKTFSAMVLQAAYPQHNFQITNNFFFSPIKRRLAMLTKNKKTEVTYISRMLVLPLAVIIFAAFTLKVDKGSFYHGKKITVVIDAGHGGSDIGAVSIEENIYEKDLNLSIAKKVRDLNTNKDINIILTRNKDLYQSPTERVAFAKAQNADLFISIHTEAATKDSANLKSGMNVFVARDNYPNVVSSKLLASAIIEEFSKNYKIPVATLPQQRKVGIWVLQENACPSVLIETGYITNDGDLNYLQEEITKETIAKNILNAINRFEITRK